MKEIINFVVAIGIAGGVVWIAKNVGDRKVATVNPLEKNQSSQVINSTRKAPSIDWDVISVHDGDTIRVKKDGKEVKVRFACIDAPEITQPLGIQSRDYLRDLIKSSRGKVGLDIVSRDRYGRSVAEVWVSTSYGGGEPGLELVQAREAAAGMVYPYERYKSDCHSWEAVQSTAKQAQDKHLGVWQKDYEKPWDYRRSNK
jgi:endonuclease YncB( thermonuclease family)